jgi:hypothetical protein
MGDGVMQFSNPPILSQHPPVLNHVFRHKPRNRRHTRDYVLDVKLSASQRQTRTAG